MLKETTTVRPLSINQQTSYLHTSVACSRVQQGENINI